MTSKPKPRPEKSLDVSTSGWNEPPFSGWIQTTEDALLILEAARRGLIPRVTRRLVDRERRMITSGSVFVFDEDESGIKRWTDGLLWSPSRILGNFLLYRETDKRGSNPSSSISVPALRTIPISEPSPLLVSEVSHGPGDSPPRLEGQTLSRPKGENTPAPHGMDRSRERVLLGSLTNSYKFKPDGMMKKTFSLTIGGVAQHLISYYKIDDVESGRLRTPSSLPELSSLNISPEYLDKTHFRVPPRIEFVEGTPRYRGEADESEVTTRKAQSSADSPPVSAESSQHMINSDSHLAYPYHTDQRDEEHPTTSGGDQDPRALAISGPGMLDHSQGDTSPVAGSSSQTNDGASETRPNGRGRRFDPYTANNTKRKVTKKQKSDPTPLRLPSAPASHPTHLLPQHAYSLPHASSSYSIPPNYSVGFVYPPHYPTTPIAENLTPSFPTFHPSQTYHSQPLVSSPSAASTNYMHYPAYNPQAIPLSPASPMPYSPQLQPPRRPYGQDRSTHNNRVASSVSASRGHDIYQGSMDTSYNSEWKASNEVPVNHHSNVPLEHEHPFYHPGTNYGHQTHPNDPDRAGVPVWSTVKGESGSSLLDV